MRCGLVELTKFFGDVVALDGVDLDVAAGQIHGIVGPNGAGKTTLLGLLLGLAFADGGTLEVLGAPVGRALAAPDGVAGFVDGPGLYPALTARGNLAALAALRGPGARTAGIDDVLEQVGLTDVADDKVRGFSLGMRQRLGLAAALLTKPRLLVLDEPANGLDPAGKRHVHRTLARLAADGAAVVLSSHRMDDLEALCSEVTIIATGRVVFSGPLDKLAAENRELDYRLLTSDIDAARRVAADTGGIQRGRRAPGSSRTARCSWCARWCPPSTSWCRGSFTRASRCASSRRSSRRLSPRSSPSPSNGNPQGQQEAGQ